MTKKNAEDALLHLEKSQPQLIKFFIAVESTPMMVVITDIKGTIEYINPKFTEITGYEREEVVGKTPHILSSGEHDTSFYKDLWDTLLSGKAWRGEFYNKKKDGSFFWSQTSIAPIREQGNEITHCVAIAQDVTQQKKAEDDLHEALLKAEDATQAKSDFLANMSHEIRTPMNVILGFLELTLRDSKLSENQQANLSKAYHAAKGLLYLINDILDVSKSESGKLKIEKTAFNLPKLLGKVFQVFETTTREKRLDFRLEMSPTTPNNVIGDPYKIKQILMNLTGNAIKFTEKGSVKIQVETLKEENLVHFMVVDTGIGIPLDKQKKIFQPFTQVDETTSRRFGGTGLGTTLSKQLVQLMGGKVWLESEIDKGSTFHFTISLPPTDLTPTETNSFGIQGIASQPCRNFRIILAEDIEDNMILAKIRLELAGHTIIPAQNGEEAIAKFEKEKPDIILMDIHMPIVDGIEATKRIRMIEKTCGGHIPIIALTASVMDNETNKYQEAGMDVVVAKPIDFDILLHKMEKIVPLDKGVWAKKIQEKTTRLTPSETIFLKKAENLEKTKAGAGKTTKVWDQDKVVELFHNILDALDKYNPYEVEPFLNKLKEYVFPQQVNPIEKYANEFNFDKAKDKTRQLAENLRIDLET